MLPFIIESHSSVVPLIREQRNVIYQVSLGCFSRSYGDQVSLHPQIENHERCRPSSCFIMFIKIKGHITTEMSDSIAGIRFDVRS